MQYNIYMSEYTPPFEITNAMLNQVADIMEQLGELRSHAGLSRTPELRREVQIESIQSSLAIEANSLSLGQVRDIVGGKRVLGPQKDIQEVKNALEAYSHIGDYNPYSLNDFLRAHGYMTHLLVDHPGELRNHGEGVYKNGVCIFVAPSPDRVPVLMNDLFAWLARTRGDINPLISSSIMHYELVFIHPFSDGNGRCARLWQTVILSHYREIFEYLPIETQVKAHQQEYYYTIDQCNNEGNSNKFIELMLNIIGEAVKETKA